MLLVKYILYFYIFSSNQPSGTFYKWDIIHIEAEENKQNLSLEE